MKIRFKTARLAKEKGFNPNDKEGDKYVPVYIIRDKESFNTKEDWGDESWVYEKYTYLDHNVYSPEQHEIAKWFRDKKDIHIEIYANMSGWGWILTKTNGTTIKEITDYNFFESYEDAMEQGIVETLGLNLI